ncbi:MAG: farnesyl diphosphate synthase [Synergistota bacterium]|nr:farnesyl diphosphate synthase [Synergistota bacterium]
MADADILKRELKDKKEIFEKYMEDWVGSRPEGVPPLMWNAMVYSLKVGGKRLRPVLCMAAAELLGGRADLVLPMAMALEMVHTASLIHDDLPAMDDDVLRRGQPTNHVVYGEALAILAGDALLCQAFELPLTELSSEISRENVVKAVAHFARSIGPGGICGGQVLDMESEGSEKDCSSPTEISTLKTAALIRTSLITGAILSGGSSEDLEVLESYGLELGVAFQIADDILDVKGDQEELGKSLGKDEAHGKRTFVSDSGMEDAMRNLKERTERAISSLDRFGESSAFLRELALYLEHRTR